MTGRTGAWMALAAILLGDGSEYGFRAHAQSLQPDPKRAAEMQDHYRHAMSMHTAVIRGDLAAVAAAAKALTQYAGPPGMPERAAAYAESIRDAASAAAAARTVVTAATSTAVMLNTCGQCHRLVGTRPSVALGPSPAVGGIVGHMVEHQRAADQMFQGLLIPSDSLWLQGTKAFAAAPLHASALPVDRIERRRLTQTEERIHRLSSEAAQATEPRARANYYGQLLAGCADCHSRSKTWGPPRGGDR